MWKPDFDAMATMPRGALRQPEMVVIDVDGTLVDSVRDLAFSVDEMMKALGLAPHGEARVRKWVGNGVERLVRRALVGELDGEPDPKLFERAYPIYLDLYAANLSAHSRLYPGAEEALDYFESAGFKMGCVTNKAAQFTEDLLKRLGVYARFGIVVSGDTLDKRKPDPAPLLHAARRLGVTPSNALMVGDSVSDVKAARAAGFQVVCVTYGYNHGLDIRDMNPDAVVDSLAEIRQLLEA